MKKYLLLTLIASSAALAAPAYTPSINAQGGPWNWSSPDKNTPVVVYIDPTTSVEVDIAVNAYSSNGLGIKTDGVNITCNNKLTHVAAGSFLVCGTSQNVTIVDDGGGSTAGAQGQVTFDPKKKI